MKPTLDMGQKNRLELSIILWLIVPKAPKRLNP